MTKIEASDTLSVLMKGIQAVTAVAAFFIMDKLNTINENFTKLNSQMTQLEARVRILEMDNGKSTERDIQRMQKLDQIIANQKAQEVKFSTAQAEIRQQLTDILILNPQLKTAKRGG